MVSYFFSEAHVSYLTDIHNFMDSCYLSSHIYFTSRQYFVHSSKFSCIKAHRILMMIFLLLNIINFHFLSYWSPHFEINCRFTVAFASDLLGRMESWVGDGTCSWFCCLTADTTVHLFRCFEDNAKVNSFHTAHFSGSLLLICSAKMPYFSAH